MMLSMVVLLQPERAPEGRGGTTILNSIFGNGVVAVVLGLGLYADARSSVMCAMSNPPARWGASNRPPLPPKT